MKQRVSISTPGRMTVLAAVLAGLTAPAFAATSSPVASVVISQVYGAGGNSGANYKSDFVELRNVSDVAVDLTGWSVQYASSTGSSWQVTKLPDGFKLQPGHYMLVQESTGAGGSTALPNPDVTGTIAMAAGAGKVALSNASTALAGTTPTANVIDFVGYGTGTNGYEGSGPTPTISATLAALRANGGCTDTNDNAADFATGAVNPRNTATAAQTCSGVTPVEPIVLTCPASLGAEFGSATMAALKATDLDSIVNSASITSATIAGITLDGFAPATAVGGNATATLNVAASLPAGSYPVTITFGNDGGQTASCTVNVSIAGSLKIPQIQGSGLTSPYANTVQTTSGVVTRLLPTGFYMQDEQGDGDPTTSDAIFVYGVTSGVNVGDLVRVTGTVSEYLPSGSTRSYTELKDTSSVTVTESGHTIVPTNIELPTELSHYEGMLVHFTTPLTVNDNNYLGDRGELVLANGRREQATNIYRAGSQESKDLMAAQELNKVVLDDGIFVTPTHIPYLGEDQTVRSGDTVTDLTGVLDFGAIGGGGGWYKLQPTETPQISRTNPRIDAPVVAPGNVRVASANVLNFFTTFTDGTDVFGHTGMGCTVGSSTSKSNCRGADSLAEFVRQRDKIVNELKAMNADAVGLMEIQNNDDITVGYLVDALNAAIGSTTYAVVPKPAATGTDAIRVAMIYKPAVLTMVGGALSDGNAINNRAPIAQTFKVNANGAKFSLIVNHLKSKGSCGSAAGESDSGDGQGCWNATRVQQATRLFTYFIPTVQAAAGDAKVLAVGDFNSYGHEDPIAYLTDNGMVNELERFIRPNGTPYSYVFDGFSGYLDHALATPALDGQVAGVTEWHNNADEPEAIDYNIGDTADDPYVDNAFRASDHDPVVVSLNLAASTVDVTGSVKIAVSGLKGNLITGKFTGTVTVTNTSGAALNGPLQLRLDGLPANVSLDNRSGLVSGVPYITIASGSLAAGAQVTVTTTFSNPAKASIVYTPALISGTF